MSNHTKEPWVVVEGGNFIEIWKKDKREVNYAKHSTRANGCLLRISLDYKFEVKRGLPDAHRICQCVNNFDGLLEASKALLEKYKIALTKLCGQKGFDVSTLREEAEQAIASAEAKAEGK